MVPAVGDTRRRRDPLKSKGPAPVAPGTDPYLNTTNEPTVGIPR